jgi:trans-2,3-dihydro-3-hydroxyanthranilate isomerase
MTSSLQYRHVDVFSAKPFSGNGLTVFVLETGLSTRAMQTITQEMRQFESIFLISIEVPNKFRAQVFTMEEELDFAGHPTLGAACVLHEKFSKDERAVWQIELNAKTVAVETTRNEANFKASMDQGKPEFGAIIEGEKRSAFVRALNLSESDVADSLPLEIVSTGLPYLIVPVKQNLEKAKILVPNFEEMLAEFGAKFVYVFGLSEMEGRTWDNFGMVEDVATGSAVGPMSAYLVKHRICRPRPPSFCIKVAFLIVPVNSLSRWVGHRKIPLRFKSTEMFA